MKTMAFSLLLVLMPLFASAQSVFETAGVTEADPNRGGFELDLSGYLRTALYLGLEKDRGDLRVKGKYGEASLKVKARDDRYGSGFAEIRLKGGTEYGETSTDIDIREIYVSVRPGRFDIKLGKQIVVWGRGDNINPTGNVTSNNLFALSPEEDDRREGNFLLRSFYTLKAFRIEAIWVPIYKPSVLPGDLGRSTGFGEITKEFPDSSLKSGSFALKAERSGLGGLDGSLSYYNGYSVHPGLDPSECLDGGRLAYRSYRQQVFGADLAFNPGRCGLRFEAAYKVPAGDYGNNPHISNPEFFYVAGIDTNQGNWSVVAQYVGRIVLHFNELDTGNPLYPLLARGRALASQSERVQHAVSCRIEKKSSHESFSAEMLGYYNLSTAEGLVQPRCRYHFGDNLNLCAGARIIWGKDGTAYDLLARTVSAAYLEMKISF